MLGAAAHFKGDERARWTIQFYYIQAEILKKAQTLLGNKSSACLDGKGPEYHPSVNQEQKDLGIKYVLKYFSGF